MVAPGVEHWNGRREHPVQPCGDDHDQDPAYPAPVELLNAALLIGLGILLIWWAGLTLRSLVIFCGAFLLP